MLKTKEEAVKLEGSLIEFYRAAWATIDPAAYAHGWHLDAISEHLEAVSYGKIRRLLITMPPRHSKSLLASVVWPAWLWAKPKDESFPLIGPQCKFLCLSYSDPLALDLALTMRRLIESDWYQARWGHRVKITADQEAKSKFDTQVGGSRISSGFGGTLTGRGGDIKILDDPLKADDADSEIERDKVIRRYDGTLKSRITDPRHNAEVLIMQRLHDNDLAGHVKKEKDPDLVHLDLPAEFEAARRCTTRIGWRDPRTVEGEPLWPERFGHRELAVYKRIPHEWSSQWQQRPEIRGGAIIKRDWWKTYISPDGKFPKFSYCLASLDPAYTEKDENDPSGFTVWGVYAGDAGEPRVMLLDCWEKRLAIHGPDNPQKNNETYADWVRRTSLDWGLCEWVAYSSRRHNANTLLIESKASGISVAQEIRRVYRSEPWTVQLVDPKGQDKVARAYAVQDLFADGRIWAPDRDWAKLLQDQSAAFPKAAHDDLVDSMTQALSYLRRFGFALRRHEYDDDEYERTKFRSPVKPLYGI